MLPKKLPPPSQLLDIRSLPTLGYLEQSLAEKIIRSLSALQLARPKHPQLATQESALLFVALYLRAHNPKHSTGLEDKRAVALERFKQACEVTATLALDSSEENISTLVESFRELVGSSEEANWKALLL